MRFLIVDDSSTMRRIIINTLNKLGHQDVQEAGNGKEGLRGVLQLSRERAGDHRERCSASSRPASTANCRTGGQRGHRRAPGLFQVAKQIVA